MRERHLRRPQRPAVYAALLVAAFLVAAGAVAAVWRAESRPAAVTNR